VSAPIVTPDAATYRLCQGDVVAIRFFFNPELNDEMQIRPDGNVSLQLIGEYALAGRTVGDVTRDLQARYAQEIKTPRITVQVRSFGSLKAYVTGEVQRPGAVSLIGGMDLVSAVAEAGGVRNTGKTRTWILVRKGPEGKLLARKIVSSTANPPFEKLQPFDLVIVPPRAVARVDRFVDEYIRQVLPGNLQGGFQYLYNRTTSAISVLPF
jgi:protein involved in polysaccharide export with SLBB domain